MRVSETLLKAADEWAHTSARCLSRAGAIRWLVDLGLKSQGFSRAISSKSAAEASEMAGDTIDQLGDQAASDEERPTRKRRLLKGPIE